MLQQHDVRKRSCPSHKLLALVADRWSTVVIYVLTGRTVRYLQLHREIEGISQKMLTQTLQNLERSGLVRRHVFDVVPPRVEYSLTPLGEDLVPRLCALCRWCEANAEAVADAETKFKA